MKNKTLIILMAITLTLAAIIFFTKPKPTEDEVTAVSVDSPAIAIPNSLGIKELKTIEILRYLLTSLGAPVDDWTPIKKENEDALTVTDESFYDLNDILVPMQLTMSLPTAGENPASTRYAAIVETAYEETPRPSHPENDYYECDLLILRREAGQWIKDSYQEMLVDRHSGGTRYAQDCSGFNLSWQGDNAILSRIRNSGPYAGGEYVESKETIQKEDGEYKLTSE